MPTAMSLTRAVGLWSVSMVRLLVPAFYALQDTRTPVLTAAGAFVANCCCSLLLMGPVTSTGESRVADGIAALTRAFAVADLRHAGLALSTSISATVNLVLLVVFLRRRLGALGTAQLFPSFVRSLIAALAMLPAVRYVAGLTDWSQHGQLVAHAALLIAAMVVGCVVYGAAAVFLGGNEIQPLSQILRQRLTRAPTGNNTPP